MVSIIIPTYNRAHLILDTLRSVAAQTDTNWECIVVDDGSTDNTLELLESFVRTHPQFTVFSRPANRRKGANACRNFGFEQAKGTYINWLDSDDLLSKDHLQLHVEAHRQHSNALATVANANTFESVQGDRDTPWSTIVPQSDLISEMIQGRVSWQTAAVVWNREALPNRPFHEELWSSQEWTFHLEQQIKEVPYALLEATTVFVRRHDDRIGTNTSAKKYASMFRSRHIVFKELSSQRMLEDVRERFLLKRMFQAIKNTIRFKYYKTLIMQIKLLVALTSITNYKWAVLRMLFWAIPVYLISGKGERLFKLTTIEKKS